MRQQRRRIDPLWLRPLDDASEWILSGGSSGPNMSAAAICAHVNTIIAEMQQSLLRPGDRILLAPRDVGVSVGTFIAATRLGLQLVLSQPPDDWAAVHDMLQKLGLPSPVIDDREMRHDSGVFARWLRLPRDPEAVRCHPSLAEIGTSAAQPTRSGTAIHVRDLIAGVRVPTPQVTAAALHRSAAMFVNVLGLSENGSVLVLLPPSEPAALWIIAGVLSSGRKAITPHEFSFRSIENALDIGQIDDVIVPASLLTLLADSPAVAALRSSTGRVVALGTSSPEERERHDRVIGRDRLAHYAQDSSGVSHLIAPKNDELGAGFWSWSDVMPQACAVITETGERVTAGDLRRRVDRLALAMDQLPEPGVVACMFDTDLELLMAYLAASASGTRLLPLAPDCPSAWIRHLISESGATTVLLSDAKAGRRSRVPATPPDSATAVTLSQLFARSRSGQSDLLAGRAGGLMPYTSGASGLPKLVVHKEPDSSPALVAAYERELGKLFGFEPTGAHLVTLPLHQFAALNFASLALHAGQTLVFMRNWTPRRALSRLTALEITSSFMVPSMFHSLLSLPATSRVLNGTSLTSIVHSTAPCPRATKERMMGWLGPVLYEFYGATELRGCYATPQEWLARPGTVGRPLPGSDVAILDEDGNLCPPRQPGRVFLSDTGFQYAGSPPPSRDRVGDYVTVGDVGNLDDDGWLYLEGRERDYISVGGRKFHPEQVETALAGVFGVQDIAVVGIPQRHLGEVVVVAVVTDPSSGQSSQQVRRTLLRLARDRLDSAMVPARVVVLEDLPRTAYGKLRREELRQTILATLQPQHIEPAREA